MTNEQENPNYPSKTGNPSGPGRGNTPKVLLMLIFSAMFISGCAAPKDWSATGGSKADGIIRLSYEFNLYEAPEVDERQGALLAKKRCRVWGYSDADAFGGVTKSCNNHDGISGCTSWLVTKEYQCIGNIE